MTTVQQTGRIFYEQRGITSMRVLDVMLAIAVPFIYVVIGNAGSLVPWVMCFLLTGCLSGLMRRITKTRINLIEFGLLSYLSLSVIGLGVIQTYRAMYGLDFAPFADDSRYFSGIVMILEGHSVPATGYEYFMSGWYWVVSGFVGSPGNLDLLPMNWMLGALVACLSYQLAYQVVGRICPAWLVFLALIGNSVFSDTIVHLYRDVLMLVALLACMVAATKGKFVVAILAAVLCASVRMANGIMALFFIVLSARNRMRLFRENPVLATSALVTLVVGALVLDNVYKLGTHVRTFGATGDVREVKKVSILKSAAIRSERLEGSEVDRYLLDSTKMLFRLGPIGYPFMPVANLFAPVRFKSIYASVDAKIIEERGKPKIYRRSGIRARSILDWITIALWIIIGPYILVGLIQAVKATVTQRSLLLFFIVALLAITFISFQARHRALFIVLFPTFITLGYYVPQDSRWMIGLSRLLFCAAIVLMNIVPRLM